MKDKKGRSCEVWYRTFDSINHLKKKQSEDPEAFKAILFSGKQGRMHYLYNKNIN